jgi:tape measure domain-containing protein
MAQDAELKLKVSLDLAFFKQELNKIGTQLSGQPLQLNIQLNKKSIADQYRLLDRYFSRKSLTIKLNDSQVIAARKNLGTLNQSLATFRRAVATPIEIKVKYKEEGKPPVGIGGTASRAITGRVAGTQALEGKNRAELQKIYGLFREANLRVGKLSKGLAKSSADEIRDALIPAFSDSGEEAVNGLAAGLKNGSSKIAKAAARLASDTIQVVKDVFGIASPSKVFKAIGEDVGKGFELGAIASMNRAFDALEKSLQQRLGKLQAMMQPQASRRGAFPFVAKSGPIESKVLMEESASLAKQIDQVRAQLAQTQQRRQLFREGALSFQRETLAQSAGRMLPAGVSAAPRVSAQDIVTQNFYKSMQDAQRMLQENFAANSYLPRATRMFADSMQQASQGIKAIAGARAPIAALPSAQMIEQRKFQSAIMQAIKTDMQNALRQQMQGRMLPAAGQSSYRSQQQKEQQRFQEAINKAAAIDAEKAAIFAARQARTQAGEMLRQTRAQMRVSALPAAGQSSFGLMKDRQLQSSLANIGAFGRQETGGVQGIIASGKGSIFEKLKASAIAFAQNAPTVIKYLNLFRPERISVSDLPSAQEGPGQFVQRISQQLKEGLFGPGTRPAQSRQFFEFGQGAQLPGMPLQKALPPIGGSGGADRVRGMGQPPQRGGAIVPFAPATRLPEGYFESAKKYSAALEMARATSAKFTASQLPLVGGLREVASEFGFAIKQVLLFGTAYKALAFVQSLPGQILNAAKSQQQYNNALQTATQDTGTFAKELLYVDNVQRAFGLNLETTRTGFTRLYASMAPTGFDSGSIEKLFTGISAATAALQLTPDKAERVIYAFGQMASKGQIMSEELKGQLGDVLPGALAIFAKAAGMSVKEFNKAMEDGEFVGSKFRDTFAKVADELMKRFGTGAQAAGKSLQGLLNTVQGDFQRTLESFAPLANAAAQAILGPLGGSLKQLSMSAQIATGEIERTFMQLKQAQQDLGDLRTGGADPGDIRAAEQNVAALTARYKVLQKAAQDPAIAKQAQDIQSFTQELAKAGTFVMNMAKAIGGVLSPVLNILGTNLTTVISLVTSFYIGFQTARLAAMALMGVLLLYRGLSALLGFGVATQQATALAGAFNILGVSASRAQIQVVGLRLALTALVATTVIGAVVAGIVAIAGAFATMSDRAKEAAQSSRDAAKAAVDAAASGNVAGAQMSMQNILAQSRADKKALETLRSLRSRSTALQREGGFSVSLTPEESAALQGSELTKGMLGGIRGGRRQMQLPTAQQMQRLQQDFGRVAQEQKVSLQEAKSAVTTAQQVAKNIGLNVPTPSAISPEAEASDEKAKRAAEKAAEDARKLADDKRKYEADLMKISSQQAINLNEMEFDHWKNLQQAKYDFLEAGQNEWMSRELKFQRDLQAIEIRRIEAIRKARIETVKAETDAQASAYVAGDSGVGGGAAMFGATGRVFNAPGWVHGHFQNMNREALVQDTVEVVMKLLQQGVKPELGSGQKFTTGMQQAQVEQLVRRGIASHKSYASGVGAIDVFVPQGTRVPVGLSGVSNLGGAAGVSGNLPRGTQLMHLDPSSRSGAAGAAPAGVPASRIRAEAKKDYASALASQEAINAKEKENLATKYANIQAQQELNVLIREYTASIIPIEQQKLENTLLQNRISLISSGAFGDALETEQKINEAREKAALGVQMANAQIEQNNKLVKDGIIKQEEADKLNASQVEKIKQLTQGLEAYIPLLRERLKLEQSSAEAILRGEITRATPLGGMGLSAGFIGAAGAKYEEAIGRDASEEEASRVAEFQNQLTLLEERNEAIKQSIYGIGNAFGEAMTTGVASLITGTATAKEVFANFLQSVGQALSQAASQMIATYIAIGIAKMFAGLGGGGGNPAGSGGGISDSLPGIRQYAGGLGGGGAPGSMPFAPPAFADGGIVTGPTLSLIGEGKYNEAIVPLPDGRSIPVQLGGRSARDLMGNGAPGMPQAPSLSMKFETTKINGVEYVSREQLEQAMAETRRASIAGGAKQGMSMTLDKIKQSPSTRSQIGMR